jgi:ATP-dependent exoDNAse (exonuclease V) beta subunit
VAEQGATLNEILAWIETLQKQKGRIKLMTGHKSKGLEFEQVYFLDAQLISDKGQDPNIRYVIQTRAKDTLTYIQTGGRA